MSRRIRIVEIIYSFGVESGGAGRFGIELSHALNSNEFDVAVWALWKIGTAVEEERLREFSQEGLETFTAATWNESNPHLAFWEAFQQMRAALADKPADIIHAHSEFGDVAALILKATAQVPIIIRTVHYPYRHEWKGKPLRRIVLSNFLYPLLFDVEIGVAPWIASTLNRRWISRVIRKQTLFVPNAINLARFATFATAGEDSIAKRSLHIPPDAFVVGTLGRLVEQKGFEFLIEAAAIVLKQMPNVYFLIVGDGELADPLKQLSARLNIASHVIFQGPQSDVIRFMVGMDLFVSSSLWEGTSTTILESMAAGVPVLATDIPGTRELVHDQSNGWLVPAANSAVLAQAIVQALNNGSQREKLAQRARETARAYSVEKIAAEYRTIYSAAAQHIS